MESKKTELPKTIPYIFDDQPMTATKLNENRKIVRDEVNRQFNEALMPLSKAIAERIAAFNSGVTDERH